MKNVLVVQSSPRGDQSVSRKLTRDLLERLKIKGDLAVRERDVTTNPLPHITQEHLAAFFTPAEKRDARLQEVIRQSDEVVDEFLWADTVVISAPMWNFSVPSSLKAWIDHLSRAGRTFNFEDGFPKGLAGGRTVYIVSSSGGDFSQNGMQALDFQKPYLKTFLGFIGVTDVRFIRAEGVDNPATKANALARAELEMDEALTYA